MATDLAHARARYALERVQRWNWPRETVQLVKGLPVSVRTLGLAQAVALLARREAAARDLAEDLCGWLLREAPAKPLGAGSADPGALLDKIAKSSPGQTRAAEQEALRFLEVLKLFGEAKYGTGG
ncbi:MAG: type III-B CRISPR module-associated protein Cmr5 [Salinisphaera sp.]|nr:type III-B CRISPR module-associated protein Cmr5 [Salinisphaera sp.]